MKKLEEILEFLLQESLVMALILGVFYLMGRIVELIATHISPIILSVLFIIFIVVLINAALDNKL